MESEKMSSRPNKDSSQRCQDALGRAKGSKLDLTWALRRVPRRVGNGEKSYLEASKLEDCPRGTSRVPPWEENCIKLYKNQKK